MKALEKGYFKEQIKSDKQKNKQKTENQIKLEELELNKKAFAEQIKLLKEKRYNELRVERKNELKVEFDNFRK